MHTQERFRRGTRVVGYRDGCLVPPHSYHASTPLLQDGQNWAELNRKPPFLLNSLVACPKKLGVSWCLNSVVFPLLKCTREDAILQPQVLPFPSATIHPPHLEVSATKGWVHPEALPEASNPLVQRGHGASPNASCTSHEDPPGTAWTLPEPLSTAGTPQQRAATAHPGTCTHPMLPPSFTKPFFPSGNACNYWQRPVTRADTLQRSPKTKQST